MKRPKPPWNEMVLAQARRCGGDAQAATLRLKRFMIPGMIHTTPLATRRVIEKNGCVKRAMRPPSREPKRSMPGGIAYPATTSLG